MPPLDEYARSLTRRQLLSTGLGSVALASLLAEDAHAAAPPVAEYPGALPGLPHHAAKAKRVIYLFQSGAPSQIDLFDPKPGLVKHRGEDLPDSIRKGQRLTGMTSTAGAASPIAASSKYRFRPTRRKSGAWISELLPHTAKVADRICCVRSRACTPRRSTTTPAITFFQTGAQTGRPAQHRGLAVVRTGKQKAAICPPSW